MTDATIPPLLTAAELAKVLRVSLAWVYAHKEAIGYSRVGGVRFEPAMVTAYIERTRHAAPSVPAAPRAPSRSAGERQAFQPVKPTPSDSAQVIEIMRRLERGSSRRK